jgi:glycosyltransferase involved in cell wall biosynthesis
MAAKEQSKIRILVVATSPEVVGGQSVQARRLIDAFARDEEIELEFLANDPPTPFRGIKYLRTVFASLRFWFSLILRVPASDGVHVFSSAMTGYVIATLPPLIVSRIFGVPAILNYHSGELREHIENWPRTALPSMRRFDRIIVPSRFLAEILAEHGLRASAIANLSDQNSFRFRKRDPLRPVFLANRNLEAHYNVGDCLRAFRLIRDRHPDAQLIVAGSGSEERALRSLAEELAVIRAVEFAGRVEPGKMPDLCDRADIYLNSSVVDNMPLSIIEAFSAGLPVVSYATGGIPYLVTDRENGLLAPMGDVERLAELACELLANRKLAQGLIAAACVESEKYRFDAIRGDWSAAYRALAGRGPASQNE